MKNGNEMNTEELKVALQGAYNDLNSGELSEIETDEYIIVQEVTYKSASYELKMEGSTMASIGWFLLGSMGSFMLMLVTVAPLLLLVMNEDNTLDCILGLGTVIGLLSPSIRRKRVSRKYDKYIEKMRKKYLALEERREKYVLAHPEIFGFLPVTYANTANVAKLLEYVLNMRAESLKEAINLLEQEESVKGAVQEVVHEALFS